MVKGDDSSDKEYYGVLKDVLELSYPGGNHSYIFKCSWYDVQHLGRGYRVDENGIISVNKKGSLKTDEIYVLDSQVEQVFYMQDPKHEDWKFVIKTQPRDLYDIPCGEVDSDYIDVDACQQEGVDLEYHMYMNDDFVVSSLSTGKSVKVREPSVVKLVRKAIEENVIDDGFINDNEVEVQEDTSEEEEFDTEISD